MNIPNYNLTDNLPEMSSSLPEDFNGLQNGNVQDDKIYDDIHDVSDDVDGNIHAKKKTLPKRSTRGVLPNKFKDFVVY